MQMTKFNIYAFLYCVSMGKMDTEASKLFHYTMTKLETYKFFIFISIVERTN